jgi:hypothetical protein
MGAMAGLLRHDLGPSARPRFILTAGVLAIALTVALAIGLRSQGGTALTAASRAVNSNCDIIVPAHPLSAGGLATPYLLTGPRGDDPAGSGCTQAKAEGRGKLVVPSAGVSPVTKQACPTTRSFTLVDQDPSDNVTTLYLLTSAGRTAQFSQRNTGALPGATQISNGSDNALLDDFVDPALRCHPFEVPDLSQGGSPGTSQALNELSAARSQAPPAALIPQNDHMVMVHGAFSPAKTNLYRASMGQPAIAPSNTADDSPRAFCANIMSIQVSFLRDSQPVLGRAPTPDPATGNNLLTFMASRLIASYGNLDCRRYDLNDPIRVIRNNAGVAVAVIFGPQLHIPPRLHSQPPRPAS